MIYRSLLPRPDMHLIPGWQTLCIDVGLRLLDRCKHTHAPRTHTHTALLQSYRLSMYIPTHTYNFTLILQIVRTHTPQNIRRLFKENTGENTSPVSKIVQHTNVLKRLCFRIYTRRMLYNTLLHTKQH